MSWWDDFKGYMVGGNATKGLDTKPKQYDAATGMLGDIAGNAQGRTAPVAQSAQLGGAAQLDPVQQAAARAQQQQLADRLGQMGSGQLAGAGELAVNRQVGQGLAAQNAQAQMSRGANTALAMRNAARGSADLSLAGAGQAAQAQMADQASANQQLGGVLNGMRGQDIDFGGQNAQLSQQRNLMQGQFDQQTGLANQSATLQQRQMNDVAQLQALGQMLGWDQATFQNELAKRGLAAQDKGILPGLLQTAGTIGAAAATGGASSALSAGSGMSPIAAGNPGAGGYYTPR